MKFCQILTYPEAHLHAFHAARPHLLDAPYKEHAAELAEDAPDATALWAPSLAEAGHDARLIVANDVVSQCRWTDEKLEVFKPRKKTDWVREITLEQLRKFKPDVLCISDPVVFDARFIGRLKQRPRWVIGWSSSLDNGGTDWRGFDLVLSPHAACVRRAWRKHARDARIFPPAFPRSVAESVFQEPVAHDVVYSGRWVPGEEKRNKRVTALAKAALRKEQPFRLGLHLSVPEGVELPPAVRKLNQGPRDGLARYRAMSGAKIVVVEEPDEALGTTVPPGVFESTGIGVCTLVAESDGLPVLFRPGVEIVTYRGTSELIARIDEHLADDTKRVTIAKAGQERCLTEHSMEARMKVLVALLADNPGGIATAARRVWHRIRR